MEVSSPITKNSIGITFLVSVGLVAFIALLELGAITWAFIARFQASLPPATAFSMRGVPGPDSNPAQGALPDNLSLDDPLAAVPEAAPSQAQESFLPKPTPLPLARKEAPPVQDRATELVEQARALRERGDTLTALTRLREAQALAPDSPQIISEMAITYEKIGAPEKARDQWRRIYLMGESAGIYYAAADAKLGASRTGSGASRTGSGASRTGSDAGLASFGENTQQQFSALPTPAQSTEIAGGGEGGFQPNATLAIAEIVREEGSDPAAQTKFTLKIPVKSRPGSKIEVHEVAIHVYFYDLVDNRSIVETNAMVHSQFTTTPTDWAEDNMEILEVEYSLPRPDARDGLKSTAGPARTTPVETRTYFGYVARVYYKKELQDMRAEPMKLLQQFPPPATLQTEE